MNDTFGQSRRRDYPPWARIGDRRRYEAGSRRVFSRAFGRDMGPKIPVRVGRCDVIVGLRFSDRQRYIEDRRTRPVCYDLIDHFDQEERLLVTICQSDIDAAKLRNGARHSHATRAIFLIFLRSSGTGQRLIADVSSASGPLWSGSDRQIFS